MTSEYLQGQSFHSISGQSVPVLTHPHTIKKVFPYIQKSVLTKSINTIILPNKNNFLRQTLGISAGKRKSESSIKSRKLSLSFKTGILSV